MMRKCQEPAAQDHGRESPGESLIQYNGASGLSEYINAMAFSFRYFRQQPYPLFHTIGGDNRCEKPWRISGYSAKCLPEKPRSTHKTDLLKCNTLTMKELQFVHARFYEIPSKLKQDAFILKCCNAILPKRRRRREQREEGSTAYQKQVSIGYRIPKQGGESIRICRSAFMKILDLKKDRIQGVVKRFFFEGQTPSENRGGDRVLGKNDKKKLAMSNFMESFKCVETHYCRSQVTRRTYLPCELNIRKLHKLYISSVEPFLTFKEHYFGNIKKEKDDERKNELNILQELHKLKAKAFYKMLKANRKEREVFSMDCQKNLALPKLPDQRAYSLHNIISTIFYFTAYVWTDLDLPKNSSVIASALFHKLSNHNFSEKIKEIFIFADGCPDRVFGLFERHIKKKEVITNPEEYVKIIEQNAKVLKLTKDWDAFDWKTAVSQVLKPPGACHFQFQQCKRFIILKRNGTIEVQAILVFPRASVKKEKKIHMINPDLIEPGRISDKKKAHSVSKLLQEHYGPDWQTKSDLKFYKDAINFSLHNDESDPQLLLNELCTEFPPEEATGM
nr:unnamed protein product [Callosobruchus chinensis]